MSHTDFTREVVSVAITSKNTTSDTDTHKYTYARKGIPSMASQAEYNSATLNKRRAPITTQLTVRSSPSNKIQSVKLPSYTAVE